MVFVAVFIVARVAMSLFLDSLNASHLRSFAGRMPERFKGWFDEAGFAKSSAYTLDRLRLNSLLLVWDSLVLALVLFSGFLPWIYRELELATGRSVPAQALILLVISLILSLPDLPGDWWSTFRVEARHGFNNSSPSLWIADRLKGVVISSLVMYPVVCVLLLLVGLPLWWVWAFAFLFIFQLLMMILYPMFIMPLFNKFTPLPEGELRERLMSLADRTGFVAKTILVMDGSRRSGHSNAFFTGLGKSRRVVLYDTLVEQLDAEELEAVLAHEIGHHKLGHIPRGLAVAGVIMFIGMAFLGWLVAEPGFVGSFGFSFDPSRPAPALMLFSLLAGVFSFWFSPLLAVLSRRHEYQADAFASRALQGDAQPLIRALRKLHTKNLGNPVPHPLYSAFHYSHPTLVEREDALLNQHQQA